jgi:glyoxylase-like metal-dependent hydrolase (beta-lactamase superfamily II)
MAASVKVFFDADTSTLTYIVYDPKTSDAIVIDPVWDYDPASSALSTQSVDLLRKFILENNLNLHLILETHAHADHVSGAQVLKGHFPNARVGIGADIHKVQSVFKKIFNLPESFIPDGRQFDILMKEGTETRAGSLTLQTIPTPGHTPACVCYLIDNILFSGDTLFMPDSGVGRCDFPAGSAEDLYVSIHEKLYKLPDDTKVYTAHDYQPNGRTLLYESTLGEHKKKNVQLKAETSAADFVNFRKTRDKTLSAPRLLLPSIQININAGKLFPPEGNGVSYIKLPLSHK